MPWSSMVFTARFVAHKLGVEEALIEELAEHMRPKDGCLSVVDSADENDPSTTAFTGLGIEMLQQMIEDRARPYPD